MNPNHAVGSRGHREHGLRGEETHGGEERQSHQQSSERCDRDIPHFPAASPGHHTQRTRTLRVHGKHHGAAPRARAQEHLRMALVERSIAGMRKMTFPTSTIEATAWRSPQPIDKLIPSSRASCRVRNCHGRRPSWHL